MQSSAHDYLFYFYRYVQPIWYFNLRPNLELPYWIDYQKISADDRALLSIDTEYVTEDAAKRDAAYQAWQKGIMCTDPDVSLLQPFSRLNLKDEYRFIKKHFHPFWVVYVLVVRLLSFRNPVMEIFSFFTCLGVVRVNLYDSPKRHANYLSFQSRLVKESPLVSVIIPTLNRQPYLRDVLSDLASQSYKNFEVIVIDQNDIFNEAFYSAWPFTLHFSHQKEKALWLARNTAIRRAGGEFLLLFDDDSRVKPDWIEQHLKCMEYFGSHLSAGVSISVVGAVVPKNYSFFRWADQLDTGNVMIRKEVFNKLGLFDRQFERQRMGDGEFGLRAFLAGYQSVSNPYAQRLHLKVKTGGLRQMGSWDGFRPTNWFAPRPIPSVLYLIRNYFGNRSAILDIMIKIPPSLFPFRYKRKPVLLLLGGLASMVMLPLVIFQIIRSWRIANLMIKSGSKIETL
jgi:glycosyltransferase involved in cell wall biosynthesis